MSTEGWPIAQDEAGEIFLADWKARVEDLDKRAPDVDLQLLFTPEELDGLRELVAGGFHPYDLDEFLQREVVRFLELNLDDWRNEKGFEGFVRQTISGLRGDG